MSEATRSIALHNAIQLFKEAAPDAVAAVLIAAEAFNAFLNADSVNALPSCDQQAASLKPAATPALAKAKPKSAATPALAKAIPAGKVPAQSEEQIVDAAISKAQKDADAEGPTKEEVGAIITNLLAAGKRNEAVGLLAKFDAKSVSQLKEDDYAAFIEAGSNLLLSA